MSCPERIQSAPAKRYYAVCTSTCLPSNHSFHQPLYLGRWTYLELRPNLLRMTVSSVRIRIKENYMGTWVCHFLAGWPWASHSVSVSSFIKWKLLYLIGLLINWSIFCVKSLVVSDPFGCKYQKPLFLLGSKDRNIFSSGNQSVWAWFWLVQSWMPYSDCFKPDHSCISYCDVLIDLNLRPIRVSIQVSWKRLIWKWRKPQGSPDQGVVSAQ